MKFLRKHTLNSSTVLDNTVLQRLDGNIELNPTQRVVVRGDIEIEGDLFVPNGIVPGPEVTNVMYVTLDGNDNNSGFGEGPTQAKRSIRSAVNAAQQGTTIFVKSGEYYENNPVRIPPKVSIVGDNLRRVIVRPLNGPQTFNITNISRTNQITTVTSSAPHGLKPRDRIRVRSSNTAVNETDVNILDVPSPTTLQYRQAGANIASVSASGVFKFAPDLFLVNSQDYITGLVVKGIQAPAYCFNIDDDAIVDTSPYIQNCSNINGPWMRNGEEWLPFVTKQPNLAGTMVTGPRPLLDSEVDPAQVDVYGIDQEGAGSGMLIDGDRYSKQSPIKSMVGDAFTQVAQGAIGFHVTNFGYMQLVSCFAVFCSKAFYTTRGGYLSISNSVIDFGDEGFVSDGYYLDPYATGNVSPDFYSSAGSVTVNTAGSGFTEVPIAIIDPPDSNIPGNRQATAEVSIDPILGIVNAISITDSGFGYDFQPTITIVPDNGATATVNLSKNLTIDLSSLSSKPQVGSIMLLENDPVGYYISGTLNDSQPFRYDEQKCSRDVKLIVEAVMADIVLGSNYRSVTAGLSYLRSYSSKVTSLQKVETLDALAQAKILTINSTVDTSVQALISDNFDVVIDIIDQGLIAVPEIVLPAPLNAETGFPEAAAILNANKQFIQDEIVAWISDTFSFSYDEDKFKSDIELILEAVLGDMVLGTNHQSRIVAFSYLRSYALTVTEQQQSQIIAGINKTKELALLLVRDSVTKDIINNNFKIVTDVLTTLDPKRAQPFSYQPPNSTDVGTINAAAQIFANRSFIVAEIIAFVNDNLSPSGYSEELCARDTEYFVDSLLFDILYNGNSATITVADSFFNNNINVVGFQIAEHQAAYQRLKEVIGFVIDADDSWIKSVSNSAEQDTALPAGSAASALKAEDLIDIVIDTIAVGPETIPSVIEPDYENGSRFAFRNTDREIILADIPNIQFKVIKFLNETYNGNFTYNEATCRRDIGYIIDALRYDLTYGGNSQSREAGLSYAEGSVIVGEIEETQAAYEYWKEISKSILQNVEIVPSPGNNTLQDTTVSTGNPDDPKATAAKVATLLQIIIDVIDHGTGYVPQVPADPEYDLYGDSVFLVERELVLANIPDIQVNTIFYINSTYGGTITVSVFPPIQSVVNGVKANFHNVSTLSSGGTALEYVGAGITYNALPFFGGEPIPEKERIEINNGKAFTVTSDQVGNYRIGEFFTVNALTGEVTINAENLNLSGLASIGPFRRNGIPVGVQLREVSDNSALIASTGVQDGTTVPTQRAVSAYVENRYLNKIQSTTPQTVESDIIFKKDVEVQGGDLTTDQTTFNLLNTAATTVNAFGDATEINIGNASGTTFINNDLEINGGDLSVSTTTFNLVDTTATTVNFGGAATEINIGANTGVTDIKNNLNVSGDLEIDGSDLTVSTTTFNLVNTTATTVNFAGAATDVSIGNQIGTTTVNNDLLVFGDVTIHGADDSSSGYLDTSATTFNLLSRTANTINFGNEATTIEIGDTTGTTTVNNNLEVKQNIILTRDDLSIVQIESNALTVELLNTTTEIIDFAGNATEINIGANTGKTLINHDLEVTGNVTVDTNLDVNGDATLGNDTTDVTTVNGFLNINLADNEASALDFKEGTNGYIKIDTINSFEKVTFGTIPRIEILNTTDATNKDTGALVVEGGAGIEKNLHIGVNLTVDGNSNLGNDRNTDSLSVAGVVDINVPDDVGTVFEIRENLSSYIKIDTTDSSESVDFGTTPIVRILNITDSGNKDTGALVVEGGVGIERNLTVGVDLTVDRDATVTRNLSVNGGNLTTTSAAFNLVNTNATTVNFAGAATTIEIGAASGTTNINNNLDVDGDVSIDGGDLTSSTTVFNLINTTTETINFGGAATTVEIGAATGTTNVNNNLVVDLDLQVKGGDLTTTATTFNLVNTTATTVNFAGAATDIQIGSATGTTNVNNNLDVDGDLAVAGGNITSDQTLFNLLTSGVQTINAFTSSTSIDIGAASGTTSINNSLTVDGNITLGSSTTNTTTINGTLDVALPDNIAGVFELSESTNSYFKIDTSNSFELVSFGTLPLVEFLNTLDATNSSTAGAVFSGGVGVEKQLWVGTNLYVDGSSTLGDNRVFDSTTINGTVSIDLPDNTAVAFEINENLSNYFKITTTNITETIDFGATPRVNILNTTNSTDKDTGALVVKGGIGVEFNITTGLDVNVGRNVTVSNDLAVNGNDLTTTSLTFNLLNSNASSVNFAGAATDIQIGATTGTVNINNNLDVDGDVNIDGGDLTTDQATFRLINTNATVINFAGAATDIQIGSASGTTNVNNNLDVDGDINIDGGDLTVSTTTFNLVNTTATTVNFAGAATDIQIGAATGTTNINNNLDVDGDVNIDGGNITTGLSAINLLNTTVTDINAFGAATTVEIGATNSTVNINGTTESSSITTGSLVVDGGVGIDKTLNVGGDVNVNGAIELVGDITANAFNSSKLALQAPTNGNNIGERIRLYDFDSLEKPNYAIGVETRHIWTGVDVNNNDLGFKWYGGTTQVMRLSGTGNLSLVGNAVVDGNLTVDGGELITTAVTFDLLNTTATTVNFAGAATAIEIGAATGITNINNNLNVDGDIRLGSAVTLFNQGTNGFSVYDDYDIAHNGTQTGYTFTSGASKTSTILGIGVTGQFNNFIGVTGTTAANTLVIGSTSTTTNFEIRNDTGAQPVDLTGGTLLLSVSAAGHLSVTGDVEVKGGDLTTNQITFNLLNTTATTVNFAGAATAIEIGAATGITSINNDLDVDGDVNVDGGDLTTNQATFNLLNAAAATVNFAGAATDIQIGSATGTTNVNNNLVVDLDVEIKGGDLTTNQTTFNLLNAVATTVNFAGDATDIQIGSATGTTNVNNNLVVDLDVEIKGGDLTVSTTTFNLANTTATTVNFAGAATDIQIGSATGTTNINNNLVVDGDVAVKGGDITTDQLTFNLLNSVADVVNFAGEASSVVVGSVTGITSFRNDVTVAGNLTVSGTTTTINTEEIKLADNIITLNSNYTGSTPTESAGIEIERGSLAKASVIWDELNDYWTLDNATGTPYIIHHTGRDVELGVETSGNYIATIAGTTNQVNVANSGTETAAVVLSLPQDIHSGASPAFVNTTLTGDLAVNGGDITTTATAFNLIDSTATTVNFAGAATSIDIGAATGTVTIRNTETVFDSTSHIIIPVGDVAERPAVPAQGMVRYNTELQTFEGYTSAWGSLGGVKDVNGDTYIIPELSPGSNEDILYFYNNDVNTAQLSETTLSLLTNTSSTSTTSGSLVVTGGAGISENVYIGGTLNTTGAATLSSTLAVTGNATVTGDVAVNGGDVTTTALVFSLVNSNATTVNFAGAATTVEIGSSAGTTNVNNNLVVDQDVEIKGGDLTTNQTTFNLLPTTATTGNMFDVATSVNIAKSAAAASTLTVGPLLSGNGILLNGTSNGVVSVDSIVASGTVNLFAGITTGTVNLATTNGCTVNIGGTGSTTNIAELQLTTDLAVVYGGTGQSTFTDKGVVYGAGTNGLLITAASDPGAGNATTSFGILTTDASNVPVWTDTIDEGEY